MGKLTIWSASVELGFLFGEQMKKEVPSALLALSITGVCEWLANILGVIMHFGLNGWHDLTKGHFNSCITPEKFSSSKSTRFRYIVMHIKESKTMKGLSSASFLLEVVNLHQKTPDKTKEWHLFCLWAGRKFAMGSEAEFTLGQISGSLGKAKERMTIWVCKQPEMLVLCCFVHCIFTYTALDGSHSSLLRPPLFILCT